MNKSIKVQDEVYQELEKLRGKRETFSEVVARLIYTRVAFLEAFVKVTRDMGRTSRGDEISERGPQP